MKNSNKGFVKTFLIIIGIIVSLFIIGILVIIFLFAQTKSALNEARNPQVQTSGPSASSVSNIYNSIGKYTNIIRTIAESSYNGKDYSASLSLNNTTTNNGSGMNANYTYVIAGMTISQVISSVAANGEKIFVITNSGPTKYAIFGQRPDDPTKYVCVDSSGNSNQSTSLTSVNTSCI